MLMPSHTGYPFSSSNNNTSNRQFQVRCDRPHQLDESLDLSIMFGTPAHAIGVPGLLQVPLSFSSLTRFRLMLVLSLRRACNQYQLPPVTHNGLTERNEHTSLLKTLPMDLVTVVLTLVIGVRPSNHVPWYQVVPQRSA